MAQEVLRGQNKLNALVEAKKAIGLDPLREREPAQPEGKGRAKIKTQKR